MRLTSRENRRGGGKKKEKAAERAVDHTEAAAESAARGAELLMTFLAKTEWSDGG